MTVCGVILAGGKSSRMGTNKALLKIKEKTAIQHIVEELYYICNQLIVVTNQPDEYKFLDLPLISDRYKDKGPLAGIETAMHHVRAETFFIAACDMPFINRKIYQYLYGQLYEYDAVVPNYDNQLHPLSGIYRKKALPTIQKQIENNNLKVKSFFKELNVHYVDQFNGLTEGQLEKHFFNMNYPSQYIQAKDF